MIIQQLVRIGSLVDTDRYNALIELAYKGRTEYLAVLDCDIWNNGSPLSPKTYEFRTEERDLYALGYAPGNALPSISHPIKFAKWAEARENLSQAKKLKGNSQLGRILSRIKKSSDPLILQLQKWLLDNIERIYDAVSDYLFSKNEFTDKTAPKWLVLRILDSSKNGTYRWPGELGPLRRLFIESFAGDAKSGDITSLCHGCGRPSGTLSPFSGTKMYTVDQVGYSIGFNAQNSAQFLLCDDCTAKATIGLNLINSEMTFFAYSIKSGRKEIPVKYQIIPNTERQQSLEQCIKAIIRISTKGQTRTIQSLSDAFEKAERKRNLVELSEAISVLPHSLSYTVVFFSDAGQSAMKNIIGSYFFPGTRLGEIKFILEDLARGFNLSRMTEIKTQRLFHLMGPKMLPSFFAALFLGTSVDRLSLLSAGVSYRPDDRKDTIRHMFLSMIRETDRAEKSKTRGFVGGKVRNLLAVHDTLYNHGLLGGK